jgi:hypothetical protein
VENMPKKVISKQKVIQAAQSLVENGENPTLAAVRLKLGNQGSLSTIHKHLKQWKDNCFKQIPMEHGSSEQLLAVIENKRILEQAIHQQSAQNEQYSQELIKAERAVLQLKMENQNIQMECSKLRDELKEVISLKKQFENLYHAIKEERHDTYERELGEKNRFIEALQEELKNVNSQAIVEIRNLGYERDDAVMQEKVTIINLQEKIIRITEENKELSEALSKAKALHIETAKKLSFTQKMLQECVPDEAREQYNQKIHLSEVNEELGGV